MARIETVPHTGSTNADLLARLRAGERLPEGTWLVADRQDAGRGRQGREWLGGKGNFMGSTLVHPHPADPPPPTLSFVVGLAVQEAVSEMLPQPGRLMLKWPNDLLLDGAKLAGILLESADGVIVAGIGVNLASAPELPDRPTAALSSLGPAPDRDMFAARLAAAFERGLEQWRAYGQKPLFTRWQAAAHPVGTPLTVQEPGQLTLTGTFAGLSTDGALMLRLADGSSRAIHAGDVIV